MRAIACVLGCALLGCSGEPRAVVAPVEHAAAPTPEPVIVPPAAPPAPEPEPASADEVIARRASTPPTIDGALDEDAWATAAPVSIDHDWSGAAFGELETRVRIVWTPDALFLAFDGTYLETIDAPDAPSEVECDHLYGHDALEAFLDFDPSSPETYRELELGPRGHFLDVAVDRSRRPRGDVAWSSGMTLATRVDEAAHRFTIEARVPSAALSEVPLAPGDARIGLYRIGRTGEDRHFLARFPTGTERPNFHVPERFGHLVLRP